MDSKIKQRRLSKSDTRLLRAIGWAFLAQLEQRICTPQVPPINEVAALAKYGQSYASRRFKAMVEMGLLERLYDRHHGLTAYGLTVLLALFKQERREEGLVLEEWLSSLRADGDEGLNRWLAIKDSRQRVFDPLAETRQREPGEKEPKTRQRETHLREGPRQEVDNEAEAREG